MRAASRTISKREYARQAEASQWEVRTKWTDQSHRWHHRSLVGQTAQKTHDPSSFEEVPRLKQNISLQIISRNKAVDLSEG